MMMLFTVLCTTGCKTNNKSNDKKESILNQVAHIEPELKTENHRDFLRTGFALYDSTNYTEALYVFEQMQAFIENQEDNYYKGVPLIWQGHLLDLLGRREEAVSRYRQASELNIDTQFKHGQYGLAYKVSPYAGQRMETPFKRIENNSLD